MRTPKLHDVRSKIRAIKRIDLSSVDQEFLVQRVNLLCHGLVISTVTMVPGQKVFRGVKWDTKPPNVDRLTYPPANLVNVFGRANAPGQQMFYCSRGRNAPLFELKLVPGDRVALSRWRITEELLINNVGYTESVFGKLQSDRPATPQWLRSNPVGSSANRLLNEFLSEEFARDVPGDQRHLYKLSSAIAEIFLHDTYVRDKAIDTIFKPMAGLVYPALAMLGHADNIALKPDFVDQHLVLEQVEYWEIDSMDVDGKFVTYHITQLDFANAFTTEGVVEWKGRPSQLEVEIAPGGMVTLSFENGERVYRDEAGDILEPKQT